MVTSPKNTTTAMTPINVRIPDDLASQAKSLADSTPDGSMSDFVREAIANEVSRRTLCRPATKIPTISDLSSQLEQVQQKLEDQSTDLRTITQIVKGIAVQVGFELQK
jgi:Arc/MetJ-type ribon-helix-helix transcriptional regulator